MNPVTDCHDQALRGCEEARVRSGRRSPRGQRVARPRLLARARGLGAEQAPVVLAALLPGGQIVAADPPQACAQGSVSPLNRGPLAWRSPNLHGPALSWCRTTASLPRDQLLVLVIDRTLQPPRARGRADGVCQADHRYRQSRIRTTPQPAHPVILAVGCTSPPQRTCHLRGDVCRGDQASPGPRRWLEHRR
jgi:hypothetical protein